MKNFLIDFMASEVERRTSCDFNILYECTSELCCHVYKLNTDFEETSYFE